MTFRTKLLSFAAALGLAGAALGVTALAAQAQTPHLEWRAEASPKAPGEVDLTLTLRQGASLHSNGRNVPLADLKGLSAAQLGGQGTEPVRFRLARDAGTFACEGSAGRGHGSGDCDFEPGRAFAQRLAAEGRGQANDDQLLELAMSNIDGVYLDELRRQRLARASVDELIRAAHHGVGLRYLQEMAAAGYRFSELGELSDLRDHGVNARFIAALKAAGYSGLSTDDLTRLRDHGVSPEFITGMAELGYRRLAAEEFVRLRDHGVSLSYVSSLRELGYRDVSTDDLVKLRDHGVSASYVRRISTDGAPLNAEDIVRMRDRGER